MKQNVTERYHRSKIVERMIVYFLICLIVFVTAYYDKQEKNALFYAATFGAASGIFLSLYIGLKLGALRIREEDSLRKWINRLHIPSKEINVHICVVLVSLTLVTLNDSDREIVVKQKLDESFLQKIELKFNRTDINSVTEIDGNYIIKFSDGSVEYMKTNN
jgi:hypothetical protein